MSSVCPREGRVSAPEVASGVFVKRSVILESYERTRERRRRTLTKSCNGSLTILPALPPIRAPRIADVAEYKVAVLAVGGPVLAFSDVIGRCPG